GRPLTPEKAPRCCSYVRKARAGPCPPGSTRRLAGLNPAAGRPTLDRAVRPRRAEHPPVGGEGQPGDAAPASPDGPLAPVPRQGEQLLARPDVPELDRPLLASAGQGLAVGAEGQRPDGGAQGRPAGALAPAQAAQQAVGELLADGAAGLFVLEQVQ